jgi:hypothetical protein
LLHQAAGGDVELAAELEDLLTLGVQAHHPLVFVLKPDQPILNSFVALGIAPLPPHHAHLPDQDAYRDKGENNVSENADPFRAVLD